MGLFEFANKGTIFLDEIGELSPSLQAKLLRVLQEKEIRKVGGKTIVHIDVRVIAATNINIKKQIKEGKFRRDLYYRLNSLDIYIPPLRERKKDIQKMLDFYLNKFICKMNKSPITLSKNAVSILNLYPWPGNVRELRNICEKLVILTDKNEITENDLNQFKSFQDFTNKQKNNLNTNIQIKENFISIQPKILKKDLAKELGISRTTLWRMLKKLNVDK